jgi:hypothetical protein
METTAKTYQLPLMSSPSNSSNDSLSQNLFPPPHYRERPTMVSFPDEATLQQIQWTAVHTANIVQAVSMFDPGNEANDSDEEWERRGQILHVAVQVFCNNNEVGDAIPNILNLPPRVVRGHILVAGQHDQAPTTGQTIVHSVVQVFGDDTRIHPLHDPESGSLATLSTINMDQPLMIWNPEILVALFTEPDFLRPPWPATPYELYLGSPPPDFDYCPWTPTPEVIEEPRVIPGDDWLHNIKGLSPEHSYCHERHHTRDLKRWLIILPYFFYDSIHVWLVSDHIYMTRTPIMNSDL